MSDKTGKQLYEAWAHQQRKLHTFLRWDDLAASTQVHWNKKAIYGDAATPPAMNAASQRLVPDAECTQSKCACTTTGCWGECSLKRIPVVFAMNAASPTDEPIGAHHLTPESIAALAADMESCQAGGEFPAIQDRDWRTRCGVIALVIRHLVERATPVGQGSATSGEAAEFPMMLNREAFTSDLCFESYKSELSSALAFAAHVAERAAAPASVPEGDADAGFESWWEEHGQFCRAGGGDYEKTFAYAAWMHQSAAAPEVAQPAAQGERAQSEIPEGYRLVLVPDEAPGDTPDYDACAWQADCATGIEGSDKGWLSIFIREINRWCVQRATPAPTAGEPSACPTCPKETPYGPAICGKCVEAGEPSAEPDGLCNSALRAEPADLRDVIEFALDLAENKDANAAINFLTAWNWESDAFLRVQWPEFGELEAATRSRAEGGMHDEDTPISRSTYGSLAECEAEQARRDAIKATQGGKP